MAHDTTELPSPDKPLEAGHDIKAWYQQRADYARYDGMPAVTKDFGSFDKESFYRALLTARLSWLCGEVFPGQANDAAFFGGRLVRARCLKSGRGEHPAERGGEFGARRRGLARC